MIIIKLFMMFIVVTSFSYMFVPVMQKIPLTNFVYGCLCFNADIKALISALVDFDSPNQNKS